jgi:hypothetical protein
VAIAVTDQGDRPGDPAGPITIGGDPLADHGHGLQIVDELTHSWTCCGGPQGRTFTAILIA